MNFKKLFLLLPLLFVSMNILSMDSDISPTITRAIQSGNVMAVKSALDNYATKPKGSKPVQYSTSQNRYEDILEYAKLAGNPAIIQLVEAYKYELK